MINSHLRCNWNVSTNSVWFSSTLHMSRGPGFCYWGLRYWYNLYARWSMVHSLYSKMPRGMYVLGENDDVAGSNNLKSWITFQTSLILTSIANASNLKHTIDMFLCLKLPTLIYRPEQPNLEFWLDIQQC